MARDSESLRLKELCQERLAHRRLILASNRGPFDYQVTEEGRLQIRRSSGVVLNALSTLSQYLEISWVASALGEGDRRAAERAQGEHFKAPLLGQDLYLRFVVSPRNVYHKFYSIFCNPLLWFLQHLMWNFSHTPNIDETVYDAWENGYVPVNRAFAEAVVAEARECEPPPMVLLQDFHLYLAGSFIRQEMPDLTLQHFTHIPWPSPTHWQLLPSHMRQAICGGLCAHDVIGFQTQQDVHNFLYTCQSCLEGAEVDYSSQTVRFNGRLSRVQAYPLSIDVSSIQRLNASTRVQEYEKKLQPHCGEQTIVRVDRAEPSKNILRGFRSFDKLLERYPDLMGRVKFLAFLVPTRTHLRQYQRHMEEVSNLVQAINAKYGNEEWQPVELFFENNYLQAMAALHLYDVLLVNAVVDGISLVAKEGPMVNIRDGVLILSEGVGACEQLGSYSLTVSPADLEGTVQALYSALTMSDEEKGQRAAALRQAIEAEDVTHWLCQQLEQLSEIPGGAPL
ncbi:MAG: trehalose-6-phosphate synthase, partial [Dehalococcoidia bacterium]